MRHDDFSLGVKIPCGVMAFPRQTGADKYAISSMQKSLDHHDWIDSSRTHHPNNADVGTILKPRNPGEVCCPVRSPVAAEGEDVGVKIFYH